MGFEYISILPTPDEIKEQFPLAPELAALKAKRDQEIRDVFTGNSDKFLVIVGPCSADREDAVCDYVSRLDKGTGTGEGQAHPHTPESTPTSPAPPATATRAWCTSRIRRRSRICTKGIIAIRKLHMRVIEDDWVHHRRRDALPGKSDSYLIRRDCPTSPSAPVPWRTSSTAWCPAACDVPVGMKNPTSGDARRHAKRGLRCPAWP